MIKKPECRLSADKTHFDAFEDGRRIGEIDFTRRGDVFIITHTFVAPEVRGKNVGATLVENVVDLARNEGKKINPLCRFAAAEFRRNDAYEDVKA